MYNLHNISALRKSLPAVLAIRQPGLGNEGDYIQAAITVPLIEKEGELAVLFEVRSQAVARQPGDICFPGGKIEANDVGPLAAAVRETSEELGVPAENIRILGALDYLISPIGVALYPFVAELSLPQNFTLSTGEVAEVFMVPLTYLLNAKPLVTEMEMATKPINGFPFDLLAENYPRGYRRRATYPVLFYKYDKYVIWGLTARVLEGFLKICRTIV
ncbi:MAG TPA: NUDIX domain-containing protein [Methylomusa anaerophila]|uniref:Putative NUDIX hydrolase n=1 Tax=Methylomusa anaerophila TaxID=1930071 RepID=A0A348AGS6_9FIRM|nr:CoA pyrophosphatase [Methylomusa anaerophila]BBB90274.1 putative NUDIX hydrolase [Methylomusa anaerophila]HML89381.1 NUDIX domain-containing protein [Methylomusa anaerophila]